MPVVQVVPDSQISTVHELWLISREFGCVWWVDV